MKRYLTGALLAMVAVMLIPAAASFAQAPSHMQFDVSGTNNFMTSPVDFLGSIIAGEPLLVGGYWNLHVDDTGWPADTDKAVRWAYINSTYYAPNYDAIFATWTATFDENTTATSPVWDCGRSGVGTMAGTAALQTTITDFDFDAVIDPDERAFVIYSGTLIVVKNGTGLFAGYCGLGSYSGSSSNPDPVNWADDTFNGTTILDIQDCSVPTRQVSWGDVKSIYSE